MMDKDSKVMSAPDLRNAVKSIVYANEHPLIIENILRLFEKQIAIARQEVAKELLDDVIKAISFPCFPLSSDEFDRGLNAAMGRVMENLEQVRKKYGVEG
jgi:hypothetical protein